LRIASAGKRRAVYLRIRSQAVARIADRTASQHLWGSRDVIVRILYPIYHFLLVVLWNQTSISSGFRDIQRQNVMQLCNG